MQRQNIGWRDLIRSIEKVVGPEVNMFGGMAGDDITFTGTYVFTNEPIYRLWNGSIGIK